MVNLAAKTWFYPQMYKCTTLMLYPQSINVISYFHFHFSYNYVPKLLINVSFAVRLQTNELGHFVKAMQVKCFKSIVHTL